MLIDGVTFTNGPARRSSPDGTSFHVAKPGDLLEAYMELAAEMADTNVVELGIYQGGSAALAMLAGKPRCMAVIDICEPVDALDEFVATRRLSDRLKPHYGVDQADRAELARIVHDDFAGEPLDLVIDDASHRLAPTRASFEALFPLLRPGGRYLIEDWRWDLRLMKGLEQMAEDDPDRLQEGVETAMQRGPGPIASSSLARAMGEAADGQLGEHPSGHASPTEESRLLVAIVSELAAAHAVSPEVVGPVEARNWWITVERGPAPCPSPVDLAALTGPAHALLR
ncbi:MAG: class I SAM-dependent methyltransferase [Acidimicrobiia bacterium]|nr:class I SAM-dependent methyltransferase [Acidimicrobiia bacterium]